MNAFYEPYMESYKGGPTVITIVTGSAKTGHNCTSLNFQYKALNTLGTYLHIVSFLVKEDRNNKNLDVILFACSRGVQKSLFCYSRPKDS